MADEKSPPPDDPVPIESGPIRPIRLSDLPARIRMELVNRFLPGGGRALVEISLEEYDVPENGGDILPFERPDKP